MIMSLLYIVSSTLLFEFRKHVVDALLLELKNKQGMAVAVGDWYFERAKK